jgi:hypothetical protein
LLCPPPVFAPRAEDGRCRDAWERRFGEGASADIHVWAPGQIVKLFKIRVPPRFGRHEARMIRAAFAAGAPKVFDEVTLEGRFGIVLQRLDGPTLPQLLQARAVTFAKVGVILATLYTSIHKTPPPLDVLFLRRWIDDVSQTSHVSLTELVPEDADPEPPRAINAAIQSEYARLAGMSPAALTESMQPYLPILRAFVLLQRRPATPAQREQLIQRIEATLRSED